MDVLLNDHVIVVYMKALLQMFGCIIRIAASQFLIHSRNTVRGLQKTLTRNIFSDSFQNQFNSLFDHFTVHCRPLRLKLLFLPH